MSAIVANPAPALNRQIVLRRRPLALPQPDDFEERIVEVTAIEMGEVVVRTIALSIDPAMRGWVRDAASYADPVPVGDVMRSFGIGEVVASRNEGFRAGDVVSGYTGWQQFAVLGPRDIQRKVETSGAPITTALGILGMSGLAAYVGMVDIGRPQPGETVLVSSAAGSVGAAAGQLAALRGARVVGMTGSERKRAACLETFGLDACIDYRAVSDLDAAVKEACPDGIDVYFDNVGGAMLDTALANVNTGGRVALCGTISVQDYDTARGPRLERTLLLKRVTMQGFLATDHLDRFDAIVGELSGLLAIGQLTQLEDVTVGLEQAPHALARLLAGENLGKSIVQVSEH